MRAKVFLAVLAALSGGDLRVQTPPVRTRPVSPKDWAEKLDDATIVLAVPDGCETFPVLSTTGDRLVLEGKVLGKFGPGDQLSFFHGEQAYTFEVHRVSVGRMTLWPR